MKDNFDNFTAKQTENNIVVLPDNDPVKVQQRKVALDVKDAVLADADLPVARPDVDVTVQRGVRSVRGRLGVSAALLGVSVVGNLRNELKGYY
jgi:hypothetical protein